MSSEKFRCPQCGKELEEGKSSEHFDGSCPVLAIERKKINQMKRIKENLEQIKENTRNLFEVPSCLVGIEKQLMNEEERKKAEKTGNSPFT